MRSKTEMYQHQVDAVNKLKRLKVGALYMEMGTGKTRTALELATLRFTSRKIDHVIWLCPCSVKKSLAMDIRKHADVEKGEITICGIETLSSSNNTALALLSIVKNSKSMLIVDESNLVKNPNAIRSQRIAKLAEYCQYKLILNGTPISRNEADMFEQWYILDWRILGYKSYYSFAANHIEYDERFTGKIRRVLNVGYLTDKIAPYSVQIKKSECLTLPEKVEYTRHFSLTEKQYDHYVNVVSDFLDEANLRDDDRTSIWIYKAFTASQEVASGRAVTSEPREHITHEPFFSDPEDNPRIECLLDVLEDVENDKCVIWCKFEHEIHDVMQVLTGKGYKAVEFTGSVPQKKRQENLEAFYDDVQFMVANKGCAGYGLNLQHCHYAIYYNNDWDWATRAQSEDRLHRIGQEQQVTIFNICSYGTIDEQILDCLSRKENMVDNFKQEISRKNWDKYFYGKGDEMLLDGEDLQKHKCISGSTGKT